MTTCRVSMVTVGAVLLGVLIMAVSSYGCAHSGVAYSVGVGDPVCWSIPPRPDYYTNWSDSHFFKIGDTLVFNFEGGLSNVVQVTKQDYESCTAYKPFQVFNNGPANFTLYDKGVWYFITNVSNYCNLGQKISISVHDCACPVNEPPSVVSPPPAAAAAAVPPSLNSSTTQPPAAQVKTPAGAPSTPLGYNGSSSPQTYPAVKSAASMLQKQIMLIAILHAILFGSGAFVFWSSNKETHG